MRDDLFELWLLSVTCACSIISQRLFSQFSALILWHSLFQKKVGTRSDSLCRTALSEETEAVSDLSVKRSVIKLVPSRSARGLAYSLKAKQKAMSGRKKDRSRGGARRLSE